MQQVEASRVSFVCFTKHAYTGHADWGFWNKVTDIIRTVTGQKIRDGLS